MSKNKKVIGLMKYKLGGKIITEFVGLRTKTYSYLSGGKKAKGKRKCVVKIILNNNKI